MYDELDRLTQSYLSHDGEHPVHNILVYLQDQVGCKIYHRGFGLADGQTVSAEKDDQFKIASITKMFTAVLTLQFYEEGLLDLDRPVHHYLADIDFINFDTLHIYQGTSCGRSITARQLLHHGSGLADLFMDGEEQFIEYVLRNPARQYTPRLLFDLFYQFGLNRASVALPGATFHYSDTGYFLLGLLAEELSGSSLAALYRKRILEPLGMKNTFFEYFENWDHPVRMSHVFYDRVDVNTRVNTSYDWAGGGLVSTTSELARFIQELFAGTLFRSSSTLDLMANDSNEGYALGLKLSGPFMGHYGFWGGTLGYDPEQNVTISLTINQVNPPFDRLEMINNLLECFLAS